jgi:hypothetical protein
VGDAQLGYKTENAKMPLWHEKTEVEYISTILALGVLTGILAILSRGGSQEPKLAERPAELRDMCT